MPPLPRLRVAVLDELARQLRFAPAQTLRRQLERAERLAAEVDAARNYPEDWVVFRITGYRPQIEQPALIVGAALLGDLSALVERLCDAAGLSAAELDGSRYVGVEPLLARWKVSKKTIDRWRRRGLMARRVRGGDGKPRLVFSREAVERFESAHKPSLERAGAFTRIGPRLEERMIRRARVYRERFGCSLNAAALRLSRRYGRAHETVRQLLRRHDGGAARPIFAEPGPPSPRERALIERAMRLQFEPSLIARRLGRTPAAVRRIAQEQRAHRLREIRPHTHAPHPPHPLHPPSPELLEAAPVREGLGGPGETDLIALIGAARSPQVPLGVVERARARAYHALLGRASAGIAGLPPSGAGAGAIDRIETDLRWAARLKAELVRSQLPLLVRTLETTLERPLEEVRGAGLAGLLRAALAGLCDAVDLYDPEKGGRLAAPAGLAMARAASQFLKEHGGELGRGGAGRARPRLMAGAAMEDWTLSVCAWQRLLEPDRRVRPALGLIDEGAGALLAARYGWGGPPRTFAELAPELGTTPLKVVQMERRALRAALDAARAGAGR